MEVTSKPSAQPVASQPQQAVQMNVLNPAAPVNGHQQHEHNKARRLRGGGAGRWHHHHDDAVAPPNALRPATFPSIVFLQPDAER
ncbi:hypothetical protein EDB86DRAFT_3077648 [Lactarius hatsudake]|nr:hypothetical protein EDB86DRAFT_3077648 [Lactarius hatsudake]